MKIAFIVDVFPVLSETFILNQITGLLDLGHEVDIYAYHMRITPKVHDEVKEYDLLRHTYAPENYSLRSWPRLKAICLIGANFHKNPAAILQSLNSLRYSRDALRLRLLPVCLKHFKRNSYDIIHCHYGSNGNLGVLLKELGGIKGKVVTMFHGYDIRLALEYGASIYAYLRDRGDCFLCISKYSRRQLEKFGFDSHKIVDQPVGIDLDRFPLRWDEENISLNHEGRIKILTVARLVKEKGIEYGIRSVHELVKGNSNIRVQYSIIGEGILKEQLKGLVARLNLVDVVEFFGEMNHAEVSKQMRGAHIFLLPSVAEVLPVTLMEAQAVGLPVVTTDVGGISEIVADGRSGFLVSAQNPIALAGKLEYLIKHPEIWQEMGRWGRKLVEERYDTKKLNQRLVRIYGALLTNSNEMLEEIRRY
ncbi:MAG TPA: glycosyltransferase [Thermodesulfobacteriota bacterium]|nr:glycosyltransferase [Thermodesulfobacteriota bacterium]